MSGERMRFYVGTYTERLGHADGNASGVLCCDLDRATGDVRVLGASAPVRNPSVVRLSPDGKRLYAANEICDFRGGCEGALSVLDVASSPVSPRVLQQCPSAGIGPAYIHLDRSGHWLFLANYAGGSIVVFPVLEDGLLGPPACACRHIGSGPNTQRQATPHPHCIMPSPDNRFVFVSDLGTDAIWGYAFDEQTGILGTRADLLTAVTPGAGPRHLAFHPNGRALFLLNELSSVLIAFAYNPKTGKLNELSRASTLPEGCEGTSTAAEVRVAPDGRYVYASNRGHDSIAVFAFESAIGVLEPRGHVATQGKTPRNFALTPDGSMLIAANQDSRSLATYSIDAETGVPKPTGCVVSAPTPVFVEFPVCQ